MTIDEPTRHRMADTMLSVFEDLGRETERGAVVLGFAWIDEELTRALRKFCLPSPKAPKGASAVSAEKADELFGVGRPIADAAAKIDLAYRLGLLRPHAHRSLHVLRKMRNDFAHISSGMTFESDTMRSRVRALFEHQKEMMDSIVEELKEIPRFRRRLAARPVRSP